MATPVSAFQPPPDEPPPPGRHPADAVAMRDRVYSQTMQAMQSLPPVSNGQYTLRLSSPEYIDPPTFTPKQQKEAMLTGQTLGRRVKGTWELVDDASGTVVDSRRQIVARVPFFTDRGLVIHRGSNYAVGNQPRLEPGVFVRRRSNGEPDVHVATMPGQGIGHHYGLDAAKSIFTVRVGQSAAPLTPLLRILGATDEEMKAAWGEELWKANATMQGDPAIRRVKKAFLRKVDATDDELRARIAETRLTPEISARTLGHPHQVLNKDAILTATKRLLAMTKGEDEGDDRDDPSYQRVYGPEDMMAERLLKDSSGVRRRALYEATREGSLKRIPSGLLTSQLEHVLLKSGLGQSLEELNALEPLDKMTRATRLGEGGIPCYSADMEVYTAAGWKFWPDVRDTDELACDVDGRLVFSRPISLHSAFYEGPMYGAETQRISYLVTPDHRVWARKRSSGKQSWTAWQFFTAERVHRRSLCLQTATGAWTGGRSPSIYPLPAAPVEGQNRGSAARGDTVVSMLAWARFLGAYLADGSFTYNVASRSYRVEIGKVERANPAETRMLRGILRDLPFHWRYEQGRRFIVTGKYLAAYVRQFGKSCDKFVPAYIMQGSLEVRRAFFESITAFDNSGRSNRSLLYSTRSRRLRDDVATLAISLGYAVTYQQVDKTGEAPDYRVRCSQLPTASVAKQQGKREDTYSIVDYSGHVYCASVPGERLLVRRNGKTHWSGNSTQSIPPESRDVRPSQFGFFDPVRTPECYDAQTQVMTRRGWLFRSELRDTDELACMIRGNLQWRTADKHTHELYTGPMYRVESLDLSVAVTPDHRMYLRANGEWIVEPAWQAFQREQFDVLVAGPNIGPEWQGRPLEAAHDETTGDAAIVTVRKRNVFVEQVNKMLVWCVRVPGNLLFVRRKSCQGFWCGNSLRVGVDNFFASGTIKGDDGQLYSRFRDARTGGMVYRSPRQLAGAAIAVPGAEKSSDSRVLAIKNGRWDYLDRGEIDYLPGPYQDFYSPLANLVPMFSTEKAQRLAMGARMLTQAVPLVGAEAPLVRNAIPGTQGKRAYDEEYATYAGAIRAPQGGKVVAADADSIQVRYENGQEQTFDLYNNHPSNRKTYFHQQSLLKPGDTFKAGQAIAKSNYTDDTGAIALGRNLRAAFIPFRGLNFEDAVVISESAAKKLTSEHAYQHGITPDPSLKLGKAPYLGLFAAKYPRDKIDRMDDTGLIQPGHRVEYGDPLILAAKERPQDGSRIHKKGVQSYADATVTWEHEDPGVVTDVAMSKSGPVVVVRSLSASKVGDKLSGRHGNKAIISGIIPDAEMPRDPKGRPFEVLFGSEGVTTRANPAQKFEMWLGKIAEQTGKSIRVEDFDGTEDRADWVFRKLAAAGLTSRETVKDPDTGLDIPNVATGNMWVMKLGHMAEAKEQARGGGGYTADDTPAKGGYGGSKRLGLLNIAALMSHGAHELAREAGSIRGTRPEDFWNLFMRGENPREPGEPTVYRKFWDNLHAAGVRLYRQNHKVHLMGLTNDEVAQLADGRYVTSPATVRAGSLDPVPGGLFDKALTGSHGGKQWAAVPLPEKMPSPVLEEPLRRLLNLTKDQFEGVLAGTHEIPGSGTGPQAFERAFAKFDIDREIASARANLNAKSAVTRDEASRRLGYLKGMAKYGRKPSDFLFDAMPVLPAAWRPINMLPSGTPMVSDSNYLYGDLVRAADNLKAAKTSLGDTNAGVERLAVYRAMKAVAGLGDPVGRKSQEKEVKGILQHVMGDSPKFSTLQRQLLSTPVDTVGRGVIIPDPALDMDQVGLPVDMAIDAYSRAVVRRMVRQGHSPVAAVKAVRDRTPGALKALQDEMAERPVYMDRAPVLHKFGIMGAKPVLVPGRAVRISPLVVAPFNADFDGDTMQIHVPATDAAVSRVFEMLPSRNLFSPADFRKPNYAPGQQYQGGLYHASTAKKDKRPQTFATQQDVIRALQRGTLQADDPVTVLNVEE